MNRDRLEIELRELAMHLDLPATPDLAARVQPRIVGAPPKRRMSARRRAALVAFAVLLAAASAYAASAGLRDRVRAWLGSDAVTIERTASNGPGAVPSVTGPGSSEAAGRFRILLPRIVGPPSTISADGRGDEFVATLTWLAPAGPRRPDGRRTAMSVTEIRGTVDRRFAGKSAGPGTTVRFLTVDGKRAVALLGAPHIVIFLDAAGEPRTAETRLAVNTLLVNRGDLLLRVEADLPLRRLVAIARSTR